MRVWVVGLGTVGQWLLRALETNRESLAARYGLAPRVVGVANSRHGFIHREEGLDLAAVLRLTVEGRPLGGHPGVAHWPSAAEGLRATEADVLVEVTSSPQPDGEPGFTHMREALRRRISVATSNKWPVALHGVELAELAHEREVAFRAESTLMSGTPALGALLDGLAGARPIALRGILNATVNFILTEMADGQPYEDALAEAQRIGLAERDPGADVDGYDEMAKLMVLAGLIFGRQLRPVAVARRGISALGGPEVAEAASRDRRLKSVATLEFSAPDGGGELIARVEPTILDGNDPLARIDGIANAIVCRADPVGEISIAGPGAGLELAGQGVLSDLIAIARRASGY